MKILLGLILSGLFLVFSFSLSFWNRKRLFAYFLIVIFSISLIPSSAGYEVPYLGLLTFQKIVLVTLAIGILVVSPKLDRVKPDKHIQVALFILIVTRLISTFYAASVTTSFMFWLSSLLYWYFFYYAVLFLVKTDFQIRQVIKVFVLSGVIVALFNFIERFTGFYAPNIFPGVAARIGYWQYDRLGMTRVFGLLADPVVTAYYLVPIIPFGLFLFQTSNNKKWLWVTIFLIGGLFQNLSRATFVAIAVMGLMYLLFANKRGLAIQGLVAGALLLTVVIANPARALIEESLNPTTTESQDLYNIVTLRMGGVLQAAPQILGNLPLFGYGTGSMTRGNLMRLYYEKAGFLYFNRTEFPGPIVVSIESGLLAGLAFTVLFILAITKSFRATLRAKTRGDEVSLFIFLSLFGYTICILFNGVFLSLHVFFLLLGILNVKMNNAKIENHSSQYVE